MLWESAAVVYVISAAGTTFSATIDPVKTFTTPTQTLSGAVTALSIDRARDGVLTSGGLPSASLDIVWPQDDNASDPGTRKYIYLTADVPPAPSPTSVPRAIAFTVHDEGFPAGTKTYAMDFGDGHTAAYQSSNTFSHAYSEADLATLVNGDWPATANCKVVTP